MFRPGIYTTTAIAVAVALLLTACSDADEARAAAEQSCALAYPKGVDSDSSDSGLHTFAKYKEGWKHAQDVANLAAKAAAHESRFDALARAASNEADLWRQGRDLVYDASGIGRTDLTAAEQSQREQLMSRSSSVSAALRAECRKVLVMASE
jgi:hypothetical protein